ncbi:MAG: NAD(P)/FAD-dependent oxidoreductase [Candidatus Binatia bacterium]
MTRSNDTPDFLIVGSGLAGLAFGALMARAGRRVRVLEAHHHAGGYGHTFAFGDDRRQYRFNAQFHYVWNCGEGRTVHNFLRKLGISEAVTFEEFDRGGFDRMRMPGWSLDIPGDYAELARRLGELFPDAAGRLADFVEEIRQTEHELDAVPETGGTIALLTRLPRLRRVVRYRHATLQQVFDRFELPPEAQTLLALQWPDFMLPPAALSFFAWVMLFAGYMRGAYYPTHHFEHVIETLVRVIEGSGGEVRLGTRVTAFLERGRRVLGVRTEEVLESGESTGRFEEHHAPDTVCNMDPRRAAEMIGLGRFSAALRRRLSYDYSASNLMAYCAVEGLDLREHGFGRSNLFHTEHPDLNEVFRAMHDRGDYSRPSFAATVPSLLTDDGSDCPAGTQILELLTVAGYDRFHHLKIANARAYREKKQAVFDAMLDVLVRRYVPNLRKHLCFKMTGSPTTNERYCLSPAGNSYGSAMTPANIGPGRLDHRTSLAGFHFCNASSGFAGFTGTIWTGCRLYEHLSGDSVRPAPARR